MSDEKSMSDDDYVEEIWLFLGSRVGTKGVRSHAWVLSSDPDGHEHEMWFKATGTYAVGGDYRAKVKRQGDRVTLIGRPVFVEPHADKERQAVIAAKHRAAEITLNRLALERSQSRTDHLDEVLGPLVALARTVPAPQRDAFALYVMRRLVKVW